MKHIALIGAGNLAGSLVRGLLGGGEHPVSLSISDIDAAKCEALKARFPDLRVCSDKSDMVRTSDVVVLCVKPDQLQGVCEEIRESLLESGTLPVSVAAGVMLTTLAKWLSAGERHALVRCMPNLPVAVNAGMSVLCANTRLDDEQRTAVSSIFNAVGETVWLEDESLMDTVTALSGSGPAYFFRVMQALEQAAQGLGMDAALARHLINQTALGATLFARHSKDDSASLSAKVASKGGTTERALTVLEDAGIDRVFADALTAAADRSREMSTQLDDSAKAPPARKDKK